MKYLRNLWNSLGFKLGLDEGHTIGCVEGYELGYADCERKWQRREIEAKDFQGYDVPTFIRYKCVPK
jgi:hypothetical protein